VRRPLLALHLHPQPISIRSQLDPAILIGAQQRVALQRFQGLGRGQTLPIQSRNAEQNDLRTQVGDPFGRVSGGVAALGQAS